MSQRQVRNEEANIQVSRKTSYQDLVEMHPTIDYSCLLTPPSTKGGHPRIWNNLCSSVLLLVCIWILVIIYCEYLSFHHSASTCHWDIISGDGSDDIHIALIGDPQLTDRYSYPFLPGRLVQRIVEFLSDIHMRRMFQSLLGYTKPDGVIFMGDLMDSGRVLTDDQFEEEAQRFRWVFDDPLEISKQYYISGNHDLGYDMDKDHQVFLANRYKKYFGPINYETVINGISFVFLSATTMEYNTTHPSLYRETTDFIEYNKNNNQLPIVMVHHIPLWRPPATDCGPYRTRNKFMRDSVHYNYRNLLPRVLSSELLKMIRPFLTLSGDDHDHCKRKHSESVTEHTIGTFSWLQGNMYPSYTLLTLKSNPKYASKENFLPDYSIKICFSPNQWNIYLCYLYLGIISIIIAIWDPLSRERRIQSVLRLSSYYSMVQVLTLRIKATVWKISLAGLCLFLFFLFLLWLSV